MTLSSFSVMLFVIAALIAGALVPFQAGSNAALAQALGHPLWASAVSLLVSMLVLLPVLLMMRVGSPSIQQTTHLPWWAWCGGVAGVIYITSALLLVPRIGATNFMVCVIAGQMVASLLLDHFGWIGLPIKEINIGRVVGVVLIFLGIVIVYWYTPMSSGQSRGDVVRHHWLRLTRQIRQAEYLTTGVPCRKNVVHSARNTY